MEIVDQLAPEFEVEFVAEAFYPFEDFPPLYARYESPASLTRVFVDPQAREKARSILRTLVDERRSRAEPTAPSGEA